MVGIIVIFDVARVPCGDLHEDVDIDMISYLLSSSLYKYICLKMVGWGEIFSTLLFFVIDKVKKIELSSKLISKATTNFRKEF